VCERIECAKHTLDTLDHLSRYSVTAPFPLVSIYNQVSVADLAVYNLVDMFRGRFSKTGVDPTEGRTLLDGLHNRVSALPKIAAWIKERPVTEFWGGVWQFTPVLCWILKSSSVCVYVKIVKWYIRLYTKIVIIDILPKCSMLSGGFFVGVLYNYIAWSGLHKYKSVF